LTLFEIGLFGWMALMAFVFSPAPHHLMPNAAAFWFLMQVVTAIGFYVLAGERLPPQPRHQDSDVTEQVDASWIRQE
jgi:hypothetical protein